MEVTLAHNYAENRWEQTKIQGENGGSLCARRGVCGCTCARMCVCTHAKLTAFWTFPVVSPSLFFERGENNLAEYSHRPLVKNVILFKASKRHKTNTDLLKHKYGIAFSYICVKNKDLWGLQVYIDYSKCNLLGGKLLGTKTHKN